MRMDTGDHYPLEKGKSSIMGVLSPKLITSPYEMARPNLTKKIACVYLADEKVIGVIHIFTGSNSGGTIFFF